MRNFLGLFVGMLRRIPNLFRSRRIHHKFLVLAEDIDSARKFSRMLELTELRGNPVLQLSQDPVDEEVYSIAKTKAGAGDREDTRICWYLGITSRERVRRWELHLAEFKPDPQSSIWRKRFNSLIICWPSRLLKQVEDSTIDLTLRLAGTIGKVRDVSKLKRVSFVVTDVDSEDGISHESQSVINIPFRERLTAALAKSLKDSKNQPGSGLADPNWRRYLEENLGSDNPFTRFYETIRRVVRTSCSVFFLPEKRQHDRFQIPLLKWMAQVKPRRYRVIRKFGNALCCLGGLTALLVGGIYLNVVVSSSAAGGSTSGIDPTTAQQEIDRLLNHYKSSVFGIVPAVIGADTVEATIDRLELIRDVNQLQLTADSISDSTRLVLDEFLTGELSSKDDCVTVLRSQLQKGLSRMTSFRRSHSLGADKFKAIEDLHEDIISISASLAFLSIEQSEDFDTPCYIIPPSVDSVVLEVSNITGVQLSEYFNCITSASELGFYDSLLLACPSDLYPVINQTLSKLSYVLPRIPAREIIEKVWNKNQPEAADIELLERLSEMRDRQFMGRNLLSQSDADSADYTLNCLREVFAPRRVVIRFQRPGDEHWHIDFSLRRERGYTPSSWCGSSDDRGCYAELERASIGTAVYLVCNSKSRTHTVPAGKSGPCLNAGVHILILDKRAGEIRFDSGRFTVNYEIVEGWIDWPLQRPRT